MSNSRSKYAVVLFNLALFGASLQTHTAPPIPGSVPQFVDGSRRANYQHESRRTGRIEVIERERKFFEARVKEAQEGAGVHGRLSLRQLQRELARY